MKKQKPEREVHIDPVTDLATKHLDERIIPLLGLSRPAADQLRAIMLRTVIPDLIEAIAEFLNENRNEETKTT